MHVICAHVREGATTLVLELDLGDMSRAGRAARMAAVTQRPALASATALSQSEACAGSAVTPSPSICVHDRMDSIVSRWPTGSRSLNWARKMRIASNASREDRVGSTTGIVARVGRLVRGADLPISDGPLGPKGERRWPRRSFCDTEVVMPI